jgi:hypothetical protein
LAFTLFYNHFIPSGLQTVQDELLTDVTACAESTPKECNDYSSAKIGTPTPKGRYGFFVTHVIPSGLGRMFVSFYNHFIPSGLQTV